MTLPASRLVRPNTPESFDAVLSRLENEVGGPVVAGDGKRWCQTVLEVLRETEGSWRQHLDNNRRTLKETMKTDLELANRVDKLTEKERAVAQELDELERATLAMERVATQAVGGDEPTKALEELRERWLGWIVSCRAVTKEIQTWFIEANYRDAGGGD